MARRVVEMIAAEYRREIVRETPQDKEERKLARLIPSLRPTLPRRTIIERHFDPNTVEHPLYGRMVYAWRPNARHDNAVGLEQAQSLRELQTHLRNEARADELRMFESVVEQVRSRNDARLSTELANFVERQRAVSGETGYTNPKLEAKAMHERRFDFVRAIARVEIQRIARGSVPGLLGWGEDPEDLVRAHILGEIIRLMELDPQQDGTLIAEALENRWVEQTLCQEVTYATQTAEAEIDRLEEDAETFSSRLERPRGGRQLADLRTQQAQDHGSITHKNGRWGRKYRVGCGSARIAFMTSLKLRELQNEHPKRERKDHTKHSYASWKGSTRCRKQWEMRPRDVR